MNKRRAAARVVALRTLGGVSGAAPEDKPKPVEDRPRFQIVRIGETAILLDSRNGQTGQLRRAADGEESVWVPIRKAESAANTPKRDGPVKEIPVVEPLDIQGFPTYFAPEGLSKGEASDGYKKSAPTSPRATVLRSLAEAGKFLDERVLARFAKQFDPRRPQLVLFTWVSWSSSDKLTHHVRDGKPVFVYEEGPSIWPTCGEDCPNRYSRLFAVRQGVEWEMEHRGATDPKAGGASKKPSRGSR